MSSENVPCLSAVITVTHPEGLHARPAAALVNAIRALRCSITLTALRAPDVTVDAQALLKVLALNLRQGDQVRCIACGPDARTALMTLQRLLSGSASPPDFTAV